MADMADEIADRLEGVSTGGRGRGGHRGRGGRGGGGGGAKGRGVDLSRALSRLLRHQAANAGIQLDSEGYAPLELVVSFLLIYSSFHETCVQAGVMAYLTRFVSGYGEMGFVQS